MTSYKLQFTYFTDLYKEFYNRPETHLPIVDVTIEHEYAFPIFHNTSTGDPADVITQVTLTDVITHVIQRT